MINEIYEVKLIGKTYEIDKDILMKIPTIRTMLEDFSDNKSKIIPINRSSLLFDHVIAYIIDDTYPYPLKYFNELDYYDIIYDKNKLYDPHKNSNGKLELLSKNITEIHNLSVKIYELESKIENITENIYNCAIIGRICYYPDCSVITGRNVYCTQHKKLFNNKCSYKSPENNKFCINIVDDKSKYCLNHLQIGSYCNNKYCRNYKIKNSQVCFMHS